MYLTKLTLDPRNVNAKKCMRDCQEMHRSVMRLFHCTRNHGNILYRFNANQFSIYILSRIVPDVGNIDDGMTLAGTRNIDTMESMLQGTSKFAFDLVACPCKKVPKQSDPTHGKASNSQRKFLQTACERKEWLERKAEQNGFSILNVSEELLLSMHGKHEENNGGSFAFKSVRFFGVLQVTDPEKFYHAYCNGIGSGKSYGQGMLLLRRIASC